MLRPACGSVSVVPGDCSQDAWWPGGRCSDEEMSGRYEAVLDWDQQIEHYSALSRLSAG